MNEAQKIAAKGVPITLADGSTRTLRFGMRQNSEIEDQFGSLGGLQDAMAPMVEAMEGVDEKDEDAVSQAISRTKLMGFVGKAVACGIVGRDLDFDDAWDALDTERFGEYFIALFEALEEGNPQKAQDESEPPTLVPSSDVGRLPATPDSPGPISTISPLQFATEPTMASSI